MRFKVTSFNQNAGGLNPSPSNPVAARERPNGHSSTDIEASIMPKPLGFQADIAKRRNEAVHTAGPYAVTAGAGGSI
jgi:hypothetical protein